MRKILLMLLLMSNHLLAQNVGIGTQSPNYKLDITGGLRSGAFHPDPGSKILYLTGAVGSGANLDGGVEFRHSNGTQGIGFGFNTIYATGVSASQMLGLASHGPDGSIVFTTNLSERMRITGMGNVGIGTITPNAPLQLSNTMANRKLVLFESGNNNHQFFGLGTNNGSLRYQVSSIAANHIFYAAEDANTSRELMRIRGNGNLVISGEIENPAFVPFPSGIYVNQIAFNNWDHQAGYRKDKMGMVQLRGRFILNASATNQNCPLCEYSIGKLPVEFGSINSYYFAIAAEWGGTQLRVNGRDLSVRFPLGSQDKWISLDGVSFKQGL